MKKMIALLMALMMVLSTSLGVYAAPKSYQISPEAQALVAIGMLLGESSAGVTPEYLTKPMSRLTAAIMILRLKGICDGALTYTSKENFPDMQDCNWQGGKNIMAYLKANPQVGFKGDDTGKFRPNENMTEQEYYKVLLETLGYKTSTTQIRGDFEWSNVLEFSRSIGVLPLGKSIFTVGDLAIATVNTLKTNMKSGPKLIDSFVESGKINRNIAIAYGLYTEPVVKLEILSAVAINSKVIEISINNEVNAIDSSAMTVKDSANNVIRF